MQFLRFIFQELANFTLNLGTLLLKVIKLRPDNDYTIENLEFETIEDSYITSRKNKKIFVDWLLSNTKKRKFGNILNCDLCIYLYLASNKQCQDRQAYEDYLNN